MHKPRHRKEGGQNGRRHQQNLDTAKRIDHLECNPPRLSVPPTMANVDGIGPEKHDDCAGGGGKGEPLPQVQFPHLERKRLQQSMRRQIACVSPLDEGGVDAVVVDGPSNRDQCDVGTYRANPVNQPPPLSIIPVQAAVFSSVRAGRRGDEQKWPIDQEGRFQRQAEDVSGAEEDQKDKAVENLIIPRLLQNPKFLV
jgi:hypothetical protein